MKIDRFTVYTCDLGWRTLSFLKVGTSDGVTGWAEFTESFGNQGLVAVVDSLRNAVVGRDAMAVSLLVAELNANIRTVPGGINQQAIAVVENALYEVKARTLGISVAELLGGPMRTEIPVYWSHCGTYRQGAQAELIGVEPITSYSGLADFARTLQDSEFRYFKTNMIAFEDPELRQRPYPWTRRPSAAGLEWDNRCAGAIEKTLTAFREGMGDDLGLILDVNSGFGVNGLLRIERVVRELGLEWIEVDDLNARTLADVRRRSQTAIASGESLFGRGEYTPYFEENSLDVGIVDVAWNGIAESVRIASNAETHAIDIAPHNFYGHLSTFMSAHFCAAIPNFSMLEVDVDGVPWRDDLVSSAPLIRRGRLVLPDGPGWGVDVNEEAVAEHAIAISS